MTPRLRSTARAMCTAAVFAMVLFGAAASAQAKGPSRTTQRLQLRSYAIQMTNNSLRYLHTTWFRRTYSYQTTQVAGAVDASGNAGPSTALESLAPVAGFSAGEVPVRSQASAIYATAIALHNNYYNPASVTVSRTEALRRTVAWTTALAGSYQQDRWGHGWQSGLWVFYMGYGAKQLWSNLPQATRDMVTADVASEADYLLTVPPPFYRDASGRVLFPGDSKSEEDAWNAELLMMAAREFSDNPHAADWERQGRWYMIAAYATPNQVGTDPRITGSNVNADGTVTNHQRIHPDYMITQGEYVAKIRMIASHTRTAIPSETSNNFVTVWRALTRIKFSTRYFNKPGGTIYRRGPHWTATDKMYFPQGGAWSNYRRFNAAQMDVEAFSSGIDSMAYGWAKCHMLYVLRQQRAHKDGHIFSAGQTHFAEDEQFAAVTSAEMAYRLTVMR